MLGAQRSGFGAPPLDERVGLVEEGARIEGCEPLLIALVFENGYGGRIVEEEGRSCHEGLGVLLSTAVGGEGGSEGDGLGGVRSRRPLERDLHRIRCLGKSGRDRERGEGG